MTESEKFGVCDLQIGSRPHYLFSRLYRDNGAGYQNHRAIQAQEAGAELSRKARLLMGLEY